MPQQLSLSIIIRRRANDRTKVEQLVTITVKARVAIVTADLRPLEVTIQEHLLRRRREVLPRLAHLRTRLPVATIAIVATINVVRIVIKLKMKMEVHRPLMLPTTRK